MKKADDLTEDKFKILLVLREVEIRIEKLIKDSEMEYLKKLLIKSKELAEDLHKVNFENN